MERNCRIVRCSGYRVLKRTRGFTTLRGFGSVFISFFLLLHCSAAPQLKPVRRVLIFYEAGAYSPLPNLVDAGIRAAFESSVYRIEFYREFLDTARFPDPTDQKQFREFYIRKYKNRRPDVIVTVGPGPLKFMQEDHEKYFRGVPVIFSLPNRLPGGLTPPPELQDTTR